MMAAFKQARELECRAAESEQQVAELNRVLDETAASFEELKQEHAVTLDELAWHKRWAFGRRRERFTEGDGQGHLFELESLVADDLKESGTPHQEAEVEIKRHRRRKKRQIDWDKLHQIRHKHDLKPEEKMCSCCGCEMECIGEDVTRELEYQRPKLEAHIHVRPKYAYVRSYSSSPPQQVYEKPFVKEYLQHCRDKAGRDIAAATEETLAKTPGFARKNFSRAQLHVSNIRHIQHHAAHLSLRLRIDSNIDIPTFPGSALDGTTCNGRCRTSQVTI